MGPEQWLFLQWHEHKGSLISTFEKLFERNTFVDCTLAAEGQYLNVHKVILSACSPYFEILLNENRDKHPIIILKDVKFRSLKSIIEYMYRGEANVLSTEIKDFLSAAETLQIKGLGKQGGGDTKNTPPKELRDFVEAESLTTGSQEISHDSGEKEMWRNPDLASVLSETSCESANQNNTVFSQGDHLSTKKIAPQRITVPVMRVEEEKEIKWPKMEGNDEPRKCLKAVMPTLNLGSHAMEPVHHATVDKVLDLNVCNTSLQSVPSTNDAQMSMELTRKNELEPEPQQALGTRETEEVETASVASSAIEVSDTTEEWAEEDIEEGPTPSQATGHSAPADESHPLFDASNMTRDSVSRNIANDHQGVFSPATPKGTKSARMREVVAKQTLKIVTSAKLRKTDVVAFTSEGGFKVANISPGSPSKTTTSLYSRTQSQGPSMTSASAEASTQPAPSLPQPLTPPPVPPPSSRAFRPRPPAPTAPAPPAPPRRSRGTSKASGKGSTKGSRKGSKKGSTKGSRKSSRRRRRSPPATAATCPKGRKPFSRRIKIKGHLRKHDEWESNSSAPCAVVGMSSDAAPQKLNQCPQREEVILHQLQGVLKRLETRVGDAESPAPTPSARSTSRRRRSLSLRILPAPPVPPTLNPPRHDSHAPTEHQRACPSPGLLKGHAKRHGPGDVDAPPKSRAELASAARHALSANLVKQMTIGPFVCRECDVEFPNRKGLVRHVYSVHKASKNKAKRETMPKATSKQQQLQQLTRLEQQRFRPKHLSNKLYQCQQCNYATRCSRDFIKHLLTHSSKKSCADWQSDVSFTSQESSDECSKSKSNN